MYGALQPLSIIRCLMDTFLLLLLYVSYMLCKDVTSCSAAVQCCLLVEMSLFKLIVRLMYFIVAQLLIFHWHL